MLGIAASGIVTARTVVKDALPSGYWADESAIRNPVRSPLPENGVAGTAITPFVF